VAAIKRLFVSALEIALFALFVVGLVALFHMVSGRAMERQDTSPDILSEQAPTEQVYPPPPNDEPLPDWITLPTETAFPTPTEIPFPTPIPTPVVTPFPLAQPPIIPSLAGVAPEAYNIVIREGNTLHTVNSVDGSESLLLDLSAKSSLYLNNRGSWGAASPDGTKLALVLTTHNEPWSKGQPLPVFSIHLFDMLTGELQLLVDNGVEPVWSPDGDRIAYRDENSGLSIINVKTGEYQQIYKADQATGHYVDEISWSPQSDRLVFVDKVFRESAVIKLVSADGSHVPEELVPWERGYWLSNPIWSIDGTEIWYISLEGKTSNSDYFYNLWVMDSVGNNKRQLTQDMDILEVSNWSVDGEWLLFSAIKIFEEPEPDSDIWLINRAGIEMRRVTSGEFYESSPSWSGDGTVVLFIRDRSQLWSKILEDGIEKFIVLSSGDFIVIP